MCAIIGWSGKLPVGLLFQLLRESEHRGIDSTGLAYWKNDINANFIVKHSVRASDFIQLNRNYILDAQKATTGIGHCRRASKHLPINNASAHPFKYHGFAFAHNGFIKNWKDCRELISDRNYAESVITDSMVLGPAIEEKEFKIIYGSMSIVWTKGQKVCCFHSKKELTAAVIQWNQKNSKEIFEISIVSSTWEIIINSLKSLKNIDWTANEIRLEENSIYEISSGKVELVEKVEVNKHNSSDKFTSQTV